ncbi:MAG: hypothetical protein K2H01_03660, partial [Ruminococcus sp.]|nr:hypothetical protein [Ruminococcus sp.]
VRRSYTEENGGENNEVLEFIGDKALDFAVVRLLAQKYGQINEKNEFICNYDEGKLTRLKSKMVEKKTLARRMDELGFAKYLIMGKSDIQNNVNNEPSVKEDLFEAIIGAVAIDSNWNLKEIQSVVEVMLEPDTFLQDKTETNYVRLIQEWETQHGIIPWYKYKEATYSSTWYLPFDGISQVLPVGYDHSKVHFHCMLKLLDTLPVFRGFGASKSEARMAVCKLAYEHLQKNNMLFSIRDEIGNPNKADAINQLEILARRGYFSIPTYDFEQKYDSNGNPVWNCECHIEEYDTYWCAESSSKKDAKKTAAFGMLKFVLNEEE